MSQIKKNNIGSDTWVSSYDVYKSVTDKKRIHSYAKTMRSKGWDYKYFVANNEIPKNQNDTLNLDLVDQNDVFWDGPENYSNNCDNYSDYSDDKSYYSYYDEVCNYWNDYNYWDDYKSACYSRTCRTNRTIQNVFGI